ncbi:MAG: hypothetical protein QG591_176 [Planctomycetota bacterium]|nr:hypothetical protein [Planctomycetota bacterium]
MKFLADVNIEKSIVDELRSLGFDTMWVSEDNPYLDDMSIFSIAQEEDCILLTNDKDFGEIVFRQKLAPFRIKGQDSKEKVKLLKKLLVSHDNKLMNHFTVITKGKFRFIHI